MPKDTKRKKATKQEKDQFKARKLLGSGQAGRAADALKEARERRRKMLEGI